VQVLKLTGTLKIFMSREREKVSKFIISAFADEIDNDLEKQMDVLDQYNIKYIEMRSVNGKGLVEHSLEQVRDIKKQLDKRGFRVSAIGSPIGKIKITDDFEQHLDLFKHTIEIAKILETKYIRMFSFFMPKGEDSSKYRDEVMYRWRKFIKEAKGSGLILLHENEDDVYGSNAEKCLDLHETLNCNYMKMTFDPGNFIFSNVEDCLEAYKVLKNHVAYIHAKDGLLKEKCFVPSGEGDGKMKEVFIQLYKDGFEGFVSIEPHLHGNFPGEGPELFGVACNALKKLLSEVTKEVY
jgi:sugar phosphate isomerase/epimerase